MVMTAFFAALCCVVSPISVPLPGGVPVTLQTACVLLAGLVLGPVSGFMAMLVYLMLGAVGLPVFAGMSAGISVIAGPTGGFLLMWPFTAFIAGYIYKRFASNKKDISRYVIMASAMLLSSVVMYVGGLIWFCFVTGMDLAGAISLCLIPFIPGDILKMAMAGLLTLPLEKAIKYMLPPDTKKKVIKGI